MKNATFGQLYCGAISVICLISIAIIFNSVLHNSASLSNATVATFLTLLATAIVGALVACYKFITGSTAGSQAKDEAIKTSIDGLANSTPTVKN